MKLFKILLILFITSLSFAQRPIIAPKVTTDTMIVKNLFLYEHGSGQTNRFLTYSNTGNYWAQVPFTWTNIGSITNPIQSVYVEAPLYGIAFTTKNTSRAVWLRIQESSLPVNKTIYLPTATSAVLCGTATSPLTLNSDGNMSIAKATASIDGYLSANDWVMFNNKMSNPMTTTGDLIIGGSGGVPVRLPVGMNNEVLTIVNGVPTWSMPNIGGGFSGDTLNAFYLFVYNRGDIRSLKTDTINSLNYSDINFQKSIVPVGTNIDIGNINKWFRNFYSSYVNANEVKTILNYSYNSYVDNVYGRSQNNVKFAHDILPYSSNVKIGSNTDKFAFMHSRHFAGDTLSIDTVIMNRGYANTFRVGEIRLNGSSIISGIDNYINVASTRNLVLGESNVDNGDEGHNIIVGEGNNVSASKYSIALGGYNTLSAVHYSTAIGLGNKVNSMYSHTFGLGNEANASFQFIIGRYATIQGNPSAMNDTDNVFIIGNGTSANNRSNAFAVKRNGMVVVNSLRFPDGSIQTDAKPQSLFNEYREVLGNGDSLSFSIPSVSGYSYAGVIINGWHADSMGVGSVGYKKVGNNIVVKSNFTGDSGKRVCFTIIYRKD